MIPANSNIAALMPSPRVVVEPMRFAYLTPRMQEMMIEWLEESRSDFRDVLANTLVVGRTTFLYDFAGDRFLNRGALCRTLCGAEARFAAVRDIAHAAGVSDQPRAFQCLVRDPYRDRVNAAILPIDLHGLPVQAITVAEW